MSDHSYYLLYKRTNMVSQFWSPRDEPVLADLSFTFPPGIHAIGRLDKNSEGLLLLTTNKKITKLLFQSKTPHTRQYYVQLNKMISTIDIDRLKTGVPIIIDHSLIYTTPPCTVEIVEKPESRYQIESFPDPYKNRPICWISISLTEGKFRQVRKMMTSVGYKVKRLIRVSIENIDLGKMVPGEIVEINEKEFFEKLNLKI